MLPPSETKAPGGVPDGMDLSFPALDAVRTSLIDALATTPLSAMDVPPSKQVEAEENLMLRTGLVMPAIYRYTGVLYDALDAATLSADALNRIAIGSALFGLLRAGDSIPRYRLSAGSKVAGQSMRRWWGSLVSDVLGEAGFVVDLRSGAYQQLGPVAGITVRVESVQADGSRKVVSHFNKKYKGELARALAQAPSAATVCDAAGVADIATAAGYAVEVRGNQLTVVVGVVADTSADTA